MRKLPAVFILLIFTTFISFSQAGRFKYNLEYKNLKGKVLKTIEKKYYLNEKTNEYELNTTYTLNFNADGNLTKSEFDNKFVADDETDIIEYIYTNKKQLTQTKNVSVIKRDGYSNNFFSYDESGKLLKSENKTEKGLDNYQVYKYDAENNVKSVSRYLANEELISILGVKFEDNFTTEFMMKYTNGFALNDSKYTYKDNLLIELEYKEVQYPHTRIFTYDENRNQIKETDKKTSVVLNEFVYKYDKAKNWIVKFDKNLDAKSIIFREITYANGTVSGATEIDETYASQFKKYELAGQNPLIDEENTLTKSNWKFHYFKNPENKLIYSSGNVTLAMRENKNLRVGNMTDVIWHYNDGNKTYETKDLEVMQTGLDGGNRIWVLENNTQRIYLVSYPEATNTRGSIGNLMVFMGKKSDNKMFGYFLEHKKNNY